MWLYADGSVPNEGRSAGLGGQIRCAMAGLSRAAHRRWQAVVQARLRESCISPNKACIEALKPGFSSQTGLCMSAFLLVVELRWLEPRAAGEELICGFFNKVRSWRFFCCFPSLDLPPPSRGRVSEFDGGSVFIVRWPKTSCCSWGSERCCASPLIPERHGGDGGDWRFGLCRLSLNYAGVVMPIDNGRHYRRPLFWQPTLMTIRWSFSPAIAGISTSRRRPFSRLAMAFFFLLESSGSVPDSGEIGQSLSLLCHGGCGGGTRWRKMDPGTSKHHHGNTAGEIRCDVENAAGGAASTAAGHNRLVVDDV